MDVGGSGEPVQPWEQYVYPPIGPSLMTGDLLREVGGDPSHPSAYRLVLSPSCDLQIRDGNCDLTQVLVCKCIGFQEFVESTPTLSRLPPAKLRERLPSMLTQPHIDGHFIIPAFGNIFPGMAASLRSLELVNYADISGTDGEGRRWGRVASIDSPFRESLSWAYLLVAGRPGVPDRDFGILVNTIAPPSAEAR